MDCAETGWDVSTVFSFTVSSPDLIFSADIWEGVEMPDDVLFRNRYRIPTARLASWDYRWSGAYSVTICTWGRARWFGEIRGEEVFLSPEGEVVAQEWEKIPRGHPQVSLDEWIVMPDHIHGLLVFHGNPRDKPRAERPKHLLAQSLGVVVGQIKSNVTKRIWWNLRQPSFAWQERFHDTVVRDAEHLQRLRIYIRENPIRWALKNGNDKKGGEEP
ncbi:MAG TPA: transposase [Thermoanaerobaculia bacterium]